MNRGEVLMVATIGGPQLAVFVRTNKRGRPVIRRVYYNMGSEQAVDQAALLTMIDNGLITKRQDCADAIAILMAAEKSK